MNKIKKRKQEIKLNKMQNKCVGKSILLWKFYLCSENSYVHEIQGTHGGQFHIVDFFI